MTEQNRDLLDAARAQLHEIEMWSDCSEDSPAEDIQECLDAIARHLACGQKFLLEYSRQGAS